MRNPVATRPGEPFSFVWTPRRHPARWLFAYAVLVAGIAHLPVIAPHLDEAPYMGEEFVVLTVACFLLAVAAAVCDSTALYLLGLLTCVLAVAGYLATRLVAFPLLDDDVGNWLEPLGIVSICAEAIAAATAGWVLIKTPGRTRERASGRVDQPVWLSPNSPATPGSGTGGAAWTSSSTRSAGSVPG